MSAPARVVFLGTGAFGIPALEALQHYPAVALVGVVTAPARPAGRGGRLQVSPVSLAMSSKAVPVSTPRRVREPEAVDQLRALAPDLLVVADYGQLVPRSVLGIPPAGALNLHPSLLPRHRGAAPIAATILAGDRETAATVMLMDEGLDTGPIVAQRRLALTATETAPELERRLATMSAELLAEVLPLWLAGAITPTPQSTEGATLTRPLRREDGRLDPEQPAERLARQVRAYQPWPGSFLDADTGRLVVWAAEAVPETRPEPRSVPLEPRPEVGSLVDDGTAGLALVTSAGLLRLLVVQPAGGRPMTSQELRRGRPGLVGSFVRDGALA